MSNKDLINAQKFFKGIMSEEIDSYQKQFSLNLLKFDINDEDAKNITQLITQTTLNQQKLLHTQAIMLDTHIADHIIVLRLVPLPREWMAD